MDYKRYMEITDEIKECLETIKQDIFLGVGQSLDLIFRERYNVPHIPLKSHIEQESAETDTIISEARDMVEAMENHHYDEAVHRLTDIKAKITVRRISRRGLN